MTDVLTGWCRLFNNTPAFPNTSSSLPMRLAITGMYPSMTKKEMGEPSTKFLSIVYTPYRFTL